MSLRAGHEPQRRKPLKKKRKQGRDATGPYFITEFIRPELRERLTKLTNVVVDEITDKIDDLIRTVAANAVEWAIDEEADIWFSVVKDKDEDEGTKEIQDPLELSFNLRLPDSSGKEMVWSISLEDAWYDITSDHLDQYERSGLIRLRDALRQFADKVDRELKEEGIK
jgi:DNA-binding TFAR19-related protein (PDSD5 family)